MGTFKENSSEIATGVTGIETAVDGLEALLTSLHADVGTTLHADLATTLNATIASLATSMGTTMGAQLIAGLALLTAATKGTNHISIPLSSLYEGDGTTTVAPLGPATSPALALASATDPNQLVTWVAGNSDPVLFSCALPPSWPTNANIKIHFRAKEGVNTDHPAITAHVAFDEGDTQVVAASAAVTNTTYLEYTITIANADIKAGARVMGVELTPGTHATSSNTVIMSALWVEIYIP